MGKDFILIKYSPHKKAMLHDMSIAFLFYSNMLSSEYVGTQIQCLLLEHIFRDHKWFIAPEFDFPKLFGSIKFIRGMEDKAVLFPNA